MTDFRSRLYNRYVSNFKKDSRISGGALNSHWKWCDSRLLPLFDGLPKSAKILEIGCGSGHFLEYLRNRGFSDARGIDISEEQVAIAKEKSLSVELADVFVTLKKFNASIDVVVAIDLLEHFSKDEGLHLCDLIRRALRPAGRVIFRTPNGAGILAGSLIYGDLTHMAIYNQSSLQQLLANVGFEQVSFYETGPVPKNLIGLVRCLFWACVRAVADIVSMAETGSKQKIWTQNILCCAYRARGI